MTQELFNKVLKLYQKIEQNKLLIAWLSDDIEKINSKIENLIKEKDRLETEYKKATAEIEKLKKEIEEL